LNHLNHAKRAPIWLTFLSAALWACATASTQSYSFERISMDRGLSQSSIQVMAQGPQGYLWVGTQFGVDRFDGYRFRGWRPGDGPEALSDGFTSALFFDRDGRLWIGTSNGLNRLDPKSGRVRQYFPPAQARDGAFFTIFRGGVVEDANGDVLAASSIGPVQWNRSLDRLETVDIEAAPALFPPAQLLSDANGSLWLATRTQLWRHSDKAERFELVLRAANDGHANNSDTIAARLPDGGIVYASPDGLHLLASHGEIVRQWNVADIDPGSSRIDGVAVDPQGALWVITPEMIFRSDAPDRDDWQPMLASPLPSDLPSNYLLRINLAGTRDQRIWAGGQFGLGVLEPGSDQLKLFRHIPGDLDSLPPSLAEIGYTLMVDRFDVVWVGTNLGGLARLAPQSNRFVHVSDARPTDRSRNVVRAIAEQRIDGREWVWVSNQGSGVTVWERDADGGYARITDYSKALETLPENNIHAMVTEPGQNAVWILGQGWAAIAERPGKLLAHVALEPGSARAATFDRQGRLWIGAGHKLTRYEVSANRELVPSLSFDLMQSSPLRRFQAFELCIPTGADQSRIRSDKIIVGGYGGLASIDPDSGVVKHMLPGGPAPADPRNLIFHLHCSDDGTVWFGTRGAGLGRMDIDTDGRPVFEFFSTADGLADSTIYALLPGIASDLWLSSNAGIMRFDPASGQVDQFGPMDGVQGYEFNNTVGLIGSSGRYYFGGINGWNVFETHAIQPMLEPPIIDAAAIRFNEEIASQPGAAVQAFELPHDKNRFEIEFVGLHFAAPEEIRYAYRLQGADPDWIDSGAQRYARYASLPPGEYRFEVKAANPDGVWSEPAELAAFQIARPPWATPAAWAGYLAVLLALFWLYAHLQRRRRERLEHLIDRRTQQLRIQNRTMKQQASALKDALNARTILFANISHEFRTPLTLIRAALDTLADRPDPEAAALGRRYINRVLRLVEQLLDLSRLRTRGADTPIAPWRLDCMIEDTVRAFEPVAVEKGVRLELDTDQAWVTDRNPDPVEKILLNLIGNAVKYTPAGGYVHVEMSGIAGGVDIEVHDIGPGIPEAERKRIFERFYRTESAETDRSDGAGIGLAVVREAAAAIGARLRLDSTPGHGSTFSVWLPAEAAVDRGDPPPRESNLKYHYWLDAERERPTLVEQPAGRASDPRPDRAAKPTLLIVEDNEDLRQWLARALAPAWNVIQAGNGGEGLEQARRHAPRVIVSDLMMPVLDGFEMLKALREDPETSHIPILMLTARHDDQARLEAFRLSADAFLGKPFDLEELKLRLGQMLQSRERLKRHLGQLLGTADATGGAGDQPTDEPGADSKVSRLAVVDPDQLSERDWRLLKRIEHWLEECYADESADIGAMAEAACVTSRTLQRKLKALTGHSPARLLRDRRLQQACRQLRDTEQTIARIAHASGFGSAQYFSRVFRQQFGASPDQWRRKRA